MASELCRMFHEDDANVLRFSEQELNEVLGMMESRGGHYNSAAAGSGGGAYVMPPTSDHHHLDGCLSQLEHGSLLHLQFQPHSPGSEQHPASADNNNTSSVENNSAAGTNIGLNSFRPPSACEQQLQVERILHGSTAPSSLTANNNAMYQAPTAVPPTANNNAFVFAQGQHQHNAFSGFPPFMPQQPISSSVTGPQRVAVEKQPSVSHSSVEKQRRDRINSLIDELRDLVPPQKGTQPAPGLQGPRVSDGASAEARRPKHVVLADTITLLKNWRLNCQLSGNAQANPFSPTPTSAAAAAAAAALSIVSIKEDPESAAAPKPDPEASAIMPVIPMALSSLAGVTVEKAKAQDGVMYVQVKCRDRRGLLSDIINSLKALPLEIRTAAVVTSGDGMVRDVFEIRVDDPELTPDAVQNVVHDGLYHQMSARGDDGCGKRQKP